MGEDNEKKLNEEGMSGEGSNLPADFAEDAAQLAPLSENTIDIKKRKRGNRLGLALTLVIFACVVYALWQLGNLLKDGNATTFRELIADMDGIYLLVALAILIVIMVCDVLKYTVLNSTFGCRLGIVREAKLGLTGKYYENITPTSTGGQPMQILYMMKQGVSGSQSSSVVLLKYAVQMLAAAIVGAIVMGIWGYTLCVIEDITTQKALYISGWIGFGINACAPVFVTTIIVCPRFLKWLLNIGLVILSKLHIIKNLEARRQKVYAAIDSFAVCAQFIFKHPLKFLAVLGLCLVEPICVNIIPYFVLQAFCGDAVAGMNNLFFTVMALSMFATYSVVYIPTPGNSGALEAMFMLAFASISGEAMFWVAIVCRFFAYYIYIVLGLGMNVYDLTRSLIAKRRQKKMQTAEGGAEVQAPPEENAEGDGE